MTRRLTTQVGGNSHCCASALTLPWPAAPRVHLYRNFGFLNKGHRPRKGCTVAFSLHATTCPCLSRPRRLLAAGECGTRVGSAGAAAPDNLAGLVVQQVPPRWQRDPIVQLAMESLSAENQSGGISVQQVCCLGRLPVCFRCFLLLRRNSCQRPRQQRRGQR